MDKPKPRYSILGGYGCNLSESKLLDNLKRKVRKRDRFESRYRDFIKEKGFDADAPHQLSILVEFIYNNIRTSKNGSEPLSDAEDARRYLKDIFKETKARNPFIKVDFTLGINVLLSSTCWTVDFDNFDPHEEGYLRKTLSDPERREVGILSALHYKTGWTIIIGSHP